MLCQYHSTIFLFHAISFLFHCTAIPSYNSHPLYFYDSLIPIPLYFYSML